jgi:L-alanine-DL-glutamate epimerase-like enolase superfamily enzyme
VLQQWDDAEARAILRNIRSAMQEGARLAIIERLMPEHADDDPGAVMVDLHMMVITGGRTRSLDDFKSLLAAAGLKLAKTSPTTSGLAVIEAVHT